MNSDERALYLLVRIQSGKRKRCYNYSMPYSNKDKQRAYQREWYHRNKNPEHILSLKDQRIKRKMRWYQAYKACNPCADCGGFFHPVSMEFDHLEPDTKRQNVSIMVRSGYLMSKIYDEISRCDLVCANCHAVRTFESRPPSRVHQYQGNYGGTLTRTIK